MKKLFSIALLSLLVMQLSSAATSSFGGRSSSGFSSGSRAISVSSSSSRPSSNTVSSSSNAVKISRNDALSGLSKKGATGSNAGLLYKDFQANKAPPLSNLSKSDVSKAFSSDYRSSRRTDYYGGYNPQPSTHYREVVYVNHQSGYGIWDLMLFNSILDNVGDRRMYYNHQSDPSFQQWRNDASSACKAGDQDVCDKLADLDNEMAEYHKSGMKVDPNYVTPGVDPDIYESNNIDPKTQPTIKLCTGSIGSDYQQYATALTKITKLKVQLVQSHGSLDNINKMATGECDLGFVQNDLIPDKGLNKVVELQQPEKAILICNSLTENPTIYIGSDQTGSQYTYKQVAAANSKLNGIVNIAHSTLEIPPLLVANSCFFTVSSESSNIVKQLDKTPLTYESLSSNAYAATTLSTTETKNLTKPQYNVWWKLWQNKGTPTIKVPVSLVAPDTWADQNKQTYDLLMLERMNLQAGIN